MIAFDRKTSALLDIRDLEEFEDDVSMRTSLFSKYVPCLVLSTSTDRTSRYPIVSLSTSLQLSHIYICSRHLLSVLEDMPQIQTLEEQAIPWLCKAQWQKNLLGRTSRQRSKRSAYAERTSRTTTDIGRRYTRSRRRWRGDAAVSKACRAAITQSGGRACSINYARSADQGHCKSTDESGVYNP